MRIIDYYTQEELKQIVSISTSYKDLARKLGYSNTCSGKTINNLKEWFKEFDTSHFQTNSLNDNLQTEINLQDIFITNSKISQKTLRKYYKKGEYTIYECAICGQKPFWNGKELTLILDHINGINNDDVVENLRWVCPNCNQQLETTGSRNSNRKIFAKKYYCKDCGKEITKGSIRCISCEAKSRVIPFEKMEVSRQDLKDLIRIKSFAEIGRQFSVSDNTIRKWCIKYGLPSKKSEINNISDLDWSKI